MGILAAIKKDLENATTTFFASVPRSVNPTESPTLLKKIFNFFWRC